MKNVNIWRTLEEGGQNGIGHREDSVEETKVPLAGSYKQDGAATLIHFMAVIRKRKLFGDVLEGELHLRGKRRPILREWGACERVQFSSLERQKSG